MITYRFADFVEISKIFIFRNLHKKQPKMEGYTLKLFKIPFPTPVGRMILRLEFPILILAAITLLISFLQDRQVNPTLARIIYPQMLEYIYASFAIMVGTFCLADLTARQKVDKIE
jgi:hypothetical protein